MYLKSSPFPSITGTDEESDMKEDQVPLLSPPEVPILLDYYASCNEQTDVTSLLFKSVYM